MSQVSVPRTPISQLSCAHSEAADGSTQRQVVPGAAPDDELSRVQRAWPKLLQNIREGIVALVEPYSRSQTEAGRASLPYRATPHT